MKMEDIMKAEHKTKLTASEIAGLWSAYLNNTLTICVFKYFKANVDETDVKDVLEYALQSSEKIVTKITDVFHEEHVQMPVGFTDEDININAPSLFSSNYYLYFLKHFAKVSSSVYGVALATLARSDIRDLFSEWIASSTKLYNLSADTLLKKGTFVRIPYVSTSNEVDFVDSNAYLGSFFASDRPLNVIEITHLCSNLEANIVGNVLMTGFAQVAESNDVKHFMMRGKELTKKQVKIFTDILIDNEVLAPTHWDMDVSDSTEAPFSDKLMMVLTTVLCQSALSNLATAGAASLRKDIAGSYGRISTEIGQYSLEGAKIMIDHEWLEQPPTTHNRKVLANKK